MPVVERERIRLEASLLAPDVGRDARRFVDSIKNTLCGKKNGLGGDDKYVL